MATVTKTRKAPGHDQTFGVVTPASESEYALVMTKMRQPAPRPRSVNRARLLALLDAEPSAGLILVSAPAGYGKTTLLTAWSHARAEASVAWYALDPSDNEPLTFGSYLVASLSHALGLAAGLASVSQHLRSSPESDLQQILPVVINAVSTSERD